MKRGCSSFLALLALTVASKHESHTADSRSSDSAPRLQSKGDASNAVAISEIFRDTEDKHDGDSLFEDVSWIDLPHKYRLELCEKGYTESMWDGYDATPWIDASWEELSSEQHEALQALGWPKDEDAYEYEIPDYPHPFTIEWKKLSDKHKLASKVLGYTEQEWFFIDHGRGTEFHPIKSKFDLPALKPLGFDYLASLTDVEVEVRDGATLGDDMLWKHYGYKMSEFVINARSSETSLYLKYEDYAAFKTQLPEVIRETVLTHLGDAIKTKSALHDLGFWKTEYDELDLNDSNWFLLVGGANTSTAIHHDVDELNFVWVLEGLKRVVVIPNDERTAGMYDCESGEAELEGDSCWPGVDILFREELPEHAFEVVLEPGEGLYIPRLSWHAVQNLEPTVGFGFRINMNWKPRWAELNTADKESATRLGYSEESWNAMIEA